MAVWSVLALLLLQSQLIVSNAEEVPDLLSFLRLPEHDGVSRVCGLSQENVTATLSDSAFTTVLLVETPSDSQTSHCRSSFDSSAEILAQLLSEHYIRVCKVAAGFQLSPEESLKPGAVLIYKIGKKISYHGLRTPSALLSYLFKMSYSQVQVIAGKLDKSAFDAIKEPKVVGFFMTNTADLKAFVDASVVLSPSVHFYAVLDRNVAKFLKLDVVGQVHLYKPMQKLPIACPFNPASALELETFITQHRGAVLTKLTEQNINEPQLVSPERSLVVAIGEQTSPLGAYLYRLLKKVVKNNTNCTAFQKINILWIEPDLFPAVYLNLKSGSTGFPSVLPSLGALKVNYSTWFDMAQLNTTANKTADEQNVALLQLWFQAVLNGTLQATSFNVQGFKQQPESQTVAEGSDFLLTCVVEKPVGDCLWLHNGQNLGFNMARYNGEYTWAGDTLTGDCSLKVVGGHAGRQDGQWVCEMTGNNENPTITSQAAIIVIETSGKTKKSEL